MFEWLSELKLRARTILFRRRLEKDLEDEIAFHLAKREEQLRDAGNAAPETAARRQFGNAGRLREECREAWTFASVERLCADFKFAAKCFAKTPGSTMMLALTLAFGIGANTAVFSVVRAVLLRPLPYRDPAQLAFIWKAANPGALDTHAILTGNDVIAFKDRNTTLESVAVLKSWEGNPESQVDLLRTDGSERLRGALVSPNFFDLLGTKASAGRTFMASDAEGAPPAVLSNGLWRRRFGGDPGVIGQQIRVAFGRPRKESTVTVIGVVPEDFQFTYPRGTDIYLPISWSGIKPDGALFYTMIARLKPDVSPRQAQAELTAIAKDDWLALARKRTIAQKITDDVLNRTSAQVEPAAEHLKSDVRPGVLLLAAVGALVLLIACVNVGLLVLARTVQRTGELAVRAALGASRSRIVQQLLAEGATIAALGGLAGVAGAALTAPLIRSMMPPIVPRADQIGIDGAVLGFALATTIVTALVSGLTPGWTAVRRDLLESFRHTGVTVTSDRTLTFVRSSIIGLQASMVFVLLAGAGLLLESFWRLQHVDLGFEGEGVITMEMRLLNPDYLPAARRAVFQETLLARVREIPGVAQASLTTAVPMRGVDFTWVLGPKNGRRIAANMRAVDADYFAVMGIPLKAGRHFTSADTSSSRQVMIVSESYGRAQFGTTNPVGKTLDMDGTEIEIIGVAGDVRYLSVEREPEPAFYLPRSQEPSELMCLLVKPQPGVRDELIPKLRSAVVAIDPAQPVEGITTIDAIVDASTADRRFYAAATAAFASLALLLAIAGVFGVVSRLVAQQQREFAIRIAVGAGQHDLLRLIVGTGLKPIALGTAAGAAMAYSASWFLQSFMFQVAPTDPWTYSATAALLLFVGFTACLVPALRGVSIQPMAILKDE